VIAVLALAGCHSDKEGLEPQHAEFLEGFTYGWERFNHRLSHLQVEAQGDHADVAVIGGTSTTSVVPDPLPAECDPTGCQEFPISDESTVEVRWAVVDTTAVALVPASVELLVGSGGASQSVEVPLPDGAEGVGSALITGIALDTDEALTLGDACYRPFYGWHPRDLRVALGDVTVGEGTASLDVSAAFAAGNSLEADRACVDEVNEAAQVSIVVDLVVAVAQDLAPQEADLHVEQAYVFSGVAAEPEEQPDPAPQAVDVGGADAVLGFSTIDFRFHVDDPESRGAYLRTLGWWVAPDGTANAVATNYSPFTQLSAFDYAFDGVVRAIPTGGTVERGTATAVIPADLDGDAQPVVHAVAYE
jgi:hypothetical protein